MIDRTNCIGTAGEDLKAGQLCVFDPHTGLIMAKNRNAKTRK